MSDKINKYQKRKGTKDGEIKFGHITSDNEINAVHIRNYVNYKHYISLCRTGDEFRKNGTICRSTGAFQVKAGDAITGKNIPGIYMEAVSGDIVIKSASGKVRIEGIDVEITASGSDGTKGNINISANEKVIVYGGQSVSIQGVNSTRIFSDKTCEVIGKSVLNIYGGLIDAVDSSSVANTSLGVLGGSDNEDRMRKS